MLGIFQVFEMGVSYGADFYPEEKATYSTTIRTNYQIGIVGGHKGKKARMTYPQGVVDDIDADLDKCGKTKKFTSNDMPPDRKSVV